MRIKFTTGHHLLCRSMRNQSRVTISFCFRVAFSRTTTQKYRLCEKCLHKFTIIDSSIPHSSFLVEVLGVDTLSYEVSNWCKTSELFDECPNLVFTGQAINYWRCWNFMDDNKLHLMIWRSGRLSTTYCRGSVSTNTRFAARVQTHTQELFPSSKNCSGPRTLNVFISFHLDPS